MGSTTRPRADKTRFLALVSAILLTGCGNADPRAAYPPGTSVPVEASAANWFSDEIDKIVVTNLYPYKGEQSRADFNYVVTGPPLSFAFPKAAYASYENGRGGPQRTIHLRLDRRTTKPFATLLLKAGIRSYERTRSNSKSFDHLKMHVAIHSNLSQPSADKQSAYWLKSAHWLEDAPDEKVGDICGFNFVRGHPTSNIYSDQPNQLIGDRSLAFGDYKGLALRGADRSILAECVKSSPICLIGFDYAGRYVRFDLPREEICASEDYVQNISAMLDAHLVR